MSSSVQFPQLRKGAGPASENDGLGYLIVAVPIKDQTGALSAYVVGCYMMDWLEKIELQSVKPLTDSRPIDIFLLDRDGKRLTRLHDGITPVGIDLSDHLSSSTR